MREIKFRGKRMDTGAWVYGYYVPDALEKTHQDMVDWAFIREIFHDTAQSVMHRVVKATVGQFTGLRDKNGEEIYEGDIVFCQGGEYYQGFWEHEDTITIHNLVFCCFDVGTYENLYVSGNIYNTPSQEATAGDSIG